MRFPFVRTDRPDHFRRDLYFLFNQHYPARSVKLYIAGTKEMVFSKKKLLEKVYFIVKMTGPAMVQLTSSDFWKAPLVRISYSNYPSSHHRPKNGLLFLIRIHQGTFLLIQKLKVSDKAALTQIEHT